MSESNFVIWKNMEPGTIIVGNYVKKLEYSTKFGDRKAYVIETLDGEKLLTNCAALDKQFSRISEGQPVKVEFTGMDNLANGRTAYGFRVHYGDKYVNSVPSNKSYGTNS